ncbi:conjugative transfer signal peptidase TraF [Bosea sp. CRIB-10]|uniref:S26 family signal peptidase n=1 Tax=Bosea sp. CRIB-10 TaxID=378404 RepID=UPI0008E070AE|nr:S26 family signal peptidase [Bosea sp. CRIB-10]SFD71629.1 conjugative transfer signal peptidase TraF [Bosea sp. CRIB-10]
MTRWPIITTMLVGIAAVAFGCVTTAPIRLVWNSSASVPVGLYTIATAEPLALSDLVAVRAPAPIERFMVARGSIAAGVPLLKHVRALPRQIVCRAGSVITIDGTPSGETLARDRYGRELPNWQGCRELAEGEIFLMNAAPHSFDGRYFGPFPTRSVIGRAVALWTDEDGDGRFRWRASAR